MDVVSFDEDGARRVQNAVLGYERSLRSRVERGRGPLLEATPAAGTEFAKCLVTTPDGSGHYDARLQVANADGTLADTGASIWLLEVNASSPLVLNSIYPCVQKGNASGRNVYDLRDYPAPALGTTNNTGSLSVTGGTSSTLASLTLAVGTWLCQGAVSGLAQSSQSILTAAISRNTGSGSVFPSVASTAVQPTSAQDPGITGIGISTWALVVNTTSGQILLSGGTSITQTLTGYLQAIRIG